MYVGEASLSWDVHTESIGQNGKQDSDVRPINHSLRMTKIIEQNYEYMRRLATKLCRNKHLAEDVLQQTCLKAWQNRERFDYERAPRAWLSTILRNEYFQIARRQGRVTFVEETEISPDSKTLFHAASTVDAVATIQALSTLNKEQKEAVVLVLVYGFTYDEAARLVDSMPGTMKSRVARARDNLIQILK